MSAVPQPVSPAAKIRGAIGRAMSQIDKTGVPRGPVRSALRRSLVGEADVVHRVLAYDAAGNARDVTDAPVYAPAYVPAPIMPPEPPTAAPIPREAASGYRYERAPPASGARRFRGVT